MQRPGDDKGHGIPGKCHTAEEGSLEVVFLMEWERRDCTWSIKEGEETI